LVLRQNENCCFRLASGIERQFQSDMTDRLDLNGPLLEELERLTQNTGRKPPSWLADLVLNGPRLESWPSDSGKPNRMMLTEFLARWLKFAGISQEECQEWLLAYCCQVLKPYSKSSPSAIRHGTKATTRWVYRSAFPFDFEKMACGPAEVLFPGQPAYAAILVKWHAELLEAKQLQLDNYRPPELPPPPIPVKARYKEQFEKAMALARQEREKGAKPPAIVETLNEQGFLTRTGRRWTISTLDSCLRKNQNS
jgi:hypothetical protein